MFEVLRFGFAWVAILVLAGLTSVPPDADELPCCQTYVEQESVPFRQWISEHFNGYAPSFSPLTGKVKPQDKSQNGLCTKSKSGSWVRVIGENEPRPNGLFLSIFCETRYHTLQVFEYLSDAETWKDGILAIDVMTEEVIHGALWASTKVGEVSGAVWDCGVHLANSYLPMHWVDNLYGTASKINTMSPVDMSLYVVDFIATYMLELTISDMALFLWYLEEPAAEIIQTSGTILGICFSKVSETWQLFADFTETYSGGRMHHMPLFHSGFGLFSLIPNIIVFCSETAQTAVWKVAEAAVNFEWSVFVAFLAETVVSARAIARTCVLTLCCKTASEILWDAYFAGTGLFTTFYNQCIGVMESDMGQWVILSLRQYWASYITLNTVTYIMTGFIASICNLTYVITPITWAVVDVLVVGIKYAKDYIVVPTSTMVLAALSKCVEPLYFYSFKELSHEMQRAAMFLLQSIISTVKGAGLMVTKVGGLRKPGYKDPVDIEGSVLHWSVIYRITGLVAVGALVMLVGLFYKYMPGTRQYRRWVKPVRVREYPAPQQVQKAKSHQALKIFGQYFAAVERLKTDSNFHCFLMQCKETTIPVFLRCLRNSASRNAKIGLAKAYRATKTLKHPNVVGFSKWIRTESVCGLALEFAPHGHLRSAMASSAIPFKLNQKLSIFRQVLSAVMFVHEAGAAHLNIRPGSVLVFKMWKLVKLSGFDHVIKVNQDQVCRDYDLHHVAGPTEAIIRQQPYNPYKADAWALGSLLFYIITGDFLHTKTNTPLPAILLPALRECDIRYKKAILAMLTSLLCYDPKGRPQLCQVLEGLDNLEK